MTMRLASPVCTTLPDPARTSSDGSITTADIQNQNLHKREESLDENHLTQTSLLHQPCWIAPPSQGFKQESLNKLKQISLDLSQPPSAVVSGQGSLDQPDLVLEHSRRSSSEQAPSQDYPQQPLIMVTTNPLDQENPSPQLSCSDTTLPDRRLSVGSAASLVQLPLKLSSYGVRRVSDISHIHQLRREISGLSHLASEFYSVTKTEDPDNISLDSLHKRVLNRCGTNKYQAPHRSTLGNKCFVIITTSLTIIGITYGFWFKNFSEFSDSSVH